MRRAWHRSAAALLAVCGAAWSPWAVDHWIGEGTVDDGALRLALLAVAAGLVAWSLAHLALPPRPWIARVDGLVLALFLALPLAGEALVRYGIATRRWGLCEPALYADPNADGDFWRLHHLWTPGDGVSRRAFDPELGWSVPPTKRDPLGVVADRRVRYRREKPAVLFFGDSFVAGPVAPSEMIPQLLGELLPDLPVYNYGIGGYGLGQICLRLERALPAFDQPFVLVGIFSNDLDRTILPVRTGPKPYMAVEDGELVVRGLPLDPDVSGWVERDPPAVRSFLAARLVQKRRDLATGGVPIETTYRRAEKLAVNALVLERIVRAVRERGRPLCFVLFDMHQSIGRPGWRERFLREEMTRLEVPWIDTGAALAREAAARGVRVAHFHRPDNHPTPEANAILARVVAAKLAELGWTR